MYHSIIDESRSHVTWYTKWKTNLGLNLPVAVQLAESWSIINILPADNVIIVCYLWLA